MHSAAQRRVVWLLAIATVLTAGVGSYFAYSKPDALEHSIAAYAPEGAAGVESTDGGYRGPMADYSVPGVAEKPFLSGAVAGLVGAGATFAVIAAAGFVIARTRRGGKGGANG